jgi:hypothetical protein
LVTVELKISVIFLLCPIVNKPRFIENPPFTFLETCDFSRYLSKEAKENEFMTLCPE